MINNEYKFNPGQHLLLELQTELLEGNYVSGSKDRIDLINIIDRYNNLKIKDKLSFYRNEIVTIQRLDEPEDNSNPDNSFDADSTLQLSKTENDRLAELTLNFIYIDKPEDQYNEAMKRLLNSENVGVVGLSDTSHKIDKLRLLVISVAEQIYMFDILMWPSKAFPSELNELLSSCCVRKIVHNSQLLKACLWKCHKVEIVNIFDTQVADAMIHKKETGQELERMRNLSECLLNRLHLPGSLLEQIKNVDTEKWDRRPLDYFQVRQASFLATYLITLKNHLQQTMLKHFHNSVRLSGNSLRNVSFYQSYATLISRKIPDRQKDYLAKEENIFI